MKYEIAYKYTSTRVSLVEADSIKEAEQNFENGIILEDWEDDSEGSVIQDIKKC